jgi:sigma-B regulation protein RsbQ
VTTTGTRAGVQVRNNVSLLGAENAQPIMFGHGYGTTQQMWRFVAPDFEQTHRVVLFDHVGSGDSDLGAYRRSKYDSLYGYAEDVLEIIDELELTDVVWVGHSVSGMIGALAAIERPEAFSALVLVGASPRYLNDADYAGGFEAADIDGLLAAIDANYVGWAEQMAPVLMGNADRPQLADELRDSFARTDPAVARHFARVVYLSDLRHVLQDITTPTLVLQSTDDIVAPVAVGEYLQRHIADSSLHVLDAGGHYAHLSNPKELAEQIRRFLS